MTQTRLRPARRFPLSHAQDMWCQDPSAFDPLFTIVKALRVAGELDEDALQDALNDVVERHEVLRTLIVRDAEPPYQQVEPPGPVPLYVRRRPLPEDERDAAAQELLAEAELNPVDPDQPPLLRVDLTRFDDRDAVLVLATHHTSSDAWSHQLIVRDLAAFYAARTTGVPVELPEIRQYLDYTARQQADVSGEQVAEAFGYWQDQLRDAQIFALPTDRPMPEVHTELYREHHFTASAELMAQAAALARELRGSTFMVMLAAFNVLAHELSGTAEPVIDTMIHGRGQPDYHDTVGPFLNFMPLRTDLAGCRSFRDLVRRTRTTCFEAYLHELQGHLIEHDSPDYLRPLADPNRCPVVFGFFQSPLETEAGQLAEGTRSIRRRESSSCQIPGGASWTMGELSDGGMFGCIQFSTEEFDESTIAGWVQRYCQLLAAGTTRPDQEWNRLLR